MTNLGGGEWGHFEFNWMLLFDFCIFFIEIAFASDHSK